MSPVPYGSTGAQRFTSAPAVGQAGATYYNTTTLQLFVSDGTQWVMHTPSPGDALTYQFSTTTTDADPGNGFMRLNSSTQNAATQAFLDLTQFGGGTANTQVLTWDDLGTSPYGVLTVIDPRNVGDYLMFLVTSITPATGYNKVGLTPLASNPNSPFATNDPVLVFFDRVPGASASFDGPFLQPVRLVTTGNHALTGLTAIDGVTPVAGDRIGVFYQTTGSQNGIYVAASGAWARSADADTAAEMAKGTRVWSTEGTLNAWHEWTQVNTFATLGTDTPQFRPRTVLDMVNALTYPVPLGTGHTVYDTSTQSVQVWDASAVAWKTANGFIVATSTTRPANPKDSNVLFETDTGLTYIYTGGAWQPLIPLSRPLGNLGEVALTSITAQNITSGTLVDWTGLAVTVNVGTGRRIKISFDVHITASVANNRAQVAIREGSTSIKLFNGPTMVQTANGYSHTGWVTLQPTAGSHTYKISVGMSTGTGQVTTAAGATFPAELLVEDIGV